MRYENLTIQYYYDPITKDKTINGIFKYNDKLVEKYQDLKCAIAWCINPQEDPNKRGIENTSQFLRIGLDCDIAKEGKLSAKEMVKAKKLLLAIIKYLPLQPTYIIESKNGYQPIWEFNDPYELKPDDREKFNERYKVAVKQLCKSTGLSSEGDSISRVFRLPDTYHYKNPDDPFKIKLVYEGQKTTRQKFSEVYKIDPDKSYSNNYTSEIQINEKNFERLALDYGWLTDTLMGLGEDEPWEWRGNTNSGRNNLMKSVCASVLKTFSLKGWSLDDGEDLCWFLNSKLATPLPKTEFQAMLKNKRSHIQEFNQPTPAGWVNVEQLEKYRPKPLKKVTAPIQTELKEGNIVYED